MATPDSTSKTVEIQLSRGFVTVIDESDADLTALQWHAHVDVCGRVYAVHLQRTRMHRVILGRVLGRGLLRSELVDHKDNNSLNNKRENLRLATKVTNAQNSKRRSDNTSGYKGVSRSFNKWAAEIYADGKKIRLGRFQTPEEAYEAYCKAATELHGEFARLE